MAHEPKNLIRDPADWARSWGWINRKQADELRDALRGCLSFIECGYSLDDFTPSALEEGRRILAKRVHRYPKGGKKVAAMREP